MTLQLEIERLQTVNAELERSVEHLSEKIAKLESYKAELEAELSASDAAIDDAIERLEWIRQRKCQSSNND